MDKKIIIAIDGHSSCGKSTMAKNLAREIGYTYIDSGAMYRAVTLYAIENGLFGDDGLDAAALAARMDGIRVSFATDATTGLPRTLLNGRDVERDIRTLAVSEKVSPVAALPFVRTALTRQQQDMGRGGGIVMDGRDIGTAVFPHAGLKVFVTAAPEIRARRRYDELKAKGMEASLDDILKNVQERDYIDSHRSLNPLRKAEDAVVLDNSHMTIPEQQAWLLNEYHKATRE